MSTAETGQGGEQLLTIKRLAGILDLSTRSIHRKCHMGEIPPPVKLGKSTIRWRKHDIDTWISQGCPTVSVKTP